MNRSPVRLVAAILVAACTGANAAEPAKISCAKPAEAETDAEPRGQAPTTDGTAAVSSVGNLSGGAGGGAAAASYAKTADLNAGMPNRISMNVTVPKQTQGATFGEKVNQGLHAAGNAVAQGATGGTDCDDAAALASKDKTAASDASAGTSAAVAPDTEATKLEAVPAAMPEEQ